MTEFIINNPITLRGCILYEFTKGKTPFETYKKLMKTLGDDFMDYPEFEFWYMRFARGNFDLDYDTNLEPNKRQIADLPVDIFEKIGGFLYFRDRTQLRNASKDIQLLVDKWNPEINEITYHRFDLWNIKQNWRTYEVYRSIYPPKSLPTVVNVLKNPKLRLKKLTVYRDEDWKKIEEELRESSTKLHVNDFIVKNQYETIDFRLFAPESLEEVTLFINEQSVSQINEIVNSEQCKRLKMLTIETNICPSEFPFDSFIGFPRFTIEFHWRFAELKVVEFIKKLVKCTQLELCNLDFNYVYWPTWDSIKEQLNEEDTLVPDSPNLRRYPIQGSSDIYEIDIKRTSISIERKS